MTVRRTHLLVSLIALSLVQYGSTNAQQCPANSRFEYNEERSSNDSHFVRIPELSPYLFFRSSLTRDNTQQYLCSCYGSKECSPMYCPDGPNNMLLRLRRCDKDQIPLVYRVSDRGMIESTQVHSRNRTEYPRQKNVPSLEDVKLRCHENGSIYITEERMILFDSYCLCTRDSNLFYTHKVKCDPVKRSPKEEDTEALLSVTGAVVSIAFLLVTFVVYTILPEMKNIHGLTLRGYIGCLLLTYTVFTIVHTDNHLICERMCPYFGYTMYFSLTASFFYQNVMCFDIWCIFGEMLVCYMGFGPFREIARISNVKKFVFYSTYAFGCATVLTGTLGVLNSTDVLANYRPEFKMDHHCWFETKQTKALYVYGPMTITVLCNFIFFLSTIKNIIRQKKMTSSHLRGADTQRHTELDDKWLTVRIFMIMGMNWLFILVSWLVPDLEPILSNSASGIEFQGVIIFLIFICKKNIKRRFMKQFRILVPDKTRNNTIPNTRNPTVIHKSVHDGV